MSKNVAEAINAIEKVLKESKWSCCTIHSVLTKEECDEVAKNILSKNKWIKEFFADEIATYEGHCMGFTWKRVINNHMILFWCGINHYEYSRDEIMLASGNSTGN